MQSQAQAYQTSSVMSKSPLELLILVYAGAIGALKEAEVAFIEGADERGVVAIGRARKFVTHLYTTLDFAEGGKIAQNLAGLYVFVIEKLYVAQSTKDAALIGSLKEILEDIRSGWEGVAEQTPAAKPTAAPEKAPGALALRG